MPEQGAKKDAKGNTDGAGQAAGGRRKLVLLAVPLLFVLAAGAAWAGGLLPFSHKAAPKAQAQPGPPVYVDLPEMIANLDSDPRRPRYIKLRARLEVADHDSERAVLGAMPRIQDLFQTYLRDIQPEDLRGSMGTYRLREELIARASVAAAPASVRDVLFVEMIVQ